MRIIDFDEYPVIPVVIFSRCGDKIVTEGEVWRSSDIGLKTKFDFSRIEDLFLRHLLKTYISYLIQTTSLSHTSNSFYEIENLLRKMRGLVKSEDICDGIMQTISEYRGKKNEYRLWYLKNWYIWNEEFGYELFVKKFSYSLKNIKIPGNEKGQAVLSEDENEGPLSDDEINRFINVLNNDISAENKVSRVLAWLFLTLGCNPRNLSLLKWCDFKVVGTKDHQVYLLNVPRIKKRFADNRGEFKTRELDARVGILLKLLKEEKCTDEHNFIFSNKSNVSFTSKKIHSALVLYVHQVTQNIEGEKPLHITPRRLRYTFATRLVMSGANKEKVADLLDHSDLQHVQVYFDLRHKIKSFISEAEAIRLGSIFKKFLGNIHSRQDKNEIVRDLKFSFAEGLESELIGGCGATSLCNLNPPYSCFICPKFNAFEDVNFIPILPIFFTRKLPTFYKFF